MYHQNQNDFPYVSGHNYVSTSLSEYIRNDSDIIKKKTQLKKKPQLKKYIYYSDFTSNINGMKQMNLSLGDINLT